MRLPDLMNSRRFSIPRIRIQGMHFLIFVNPIVLGIWPVLHLYNHNIDEVAFSTAAAAMLVVAVGGAIVMGLVWLVLRDCTKAGFLAVCWLFLFFSYGHVFEVIEGEKIAGFIIGRQRFLLLAYVIFATVSWWATIRIPNISLRLTPYITALVLFPVCSIVLRWC